MGKYSTLHKRLDKMQNRDATKFAPLMAFISSTKGECDLSISLWDGKPYPKSIGCPNVTHHFANYEEAINAIHRVNAEYPPTSTGMVIFVGLEDLED